MQVSHAHLLDTVELLRCLANGNGKAVWGLVESTRTIELRLVEDFDRVLCDAEAENKLHRIALVLTREITRVLYTAHSPAALLSDNQITSPFDLPSEAI